MARVSLTVNGRTYDVVCDDGQEEHLRTLAGDLDRRVAGLARQLGQIGEARLLLMAALLVEDEVQELKAALPASAEGGRGAREDERAAEQAIERAATRIDTLAERLSEA